MSLLSEDLIYEYTNSLKRYVANHEEWRTKKTLNLISSENFASPKTREYLSSDLSNRYSARDHFYEGSKYADEIEFLAVKLAKKLYKARYADVRSISGHTCSLILFLSFLKSGNKVVTCPPSHGGYPGSSELGLGRLLGLRNLYFPYDPESMNIIPNATRELLRTEKPEMTVFGSSFIPFPYEISESIPEAYEGIKVYDGSHVMGLIAGGEFQRPLIEGCSVLVGSTHKSFFGTLGGLILSNDSDVFSVIDSKIHPGIVDNIHWNRVASLAHSLLELMKFGRRYAVQVVRNSKALASHLHEVGVPVKCPRLGFTNSHQVLLGLDETASTRFADSLQEVDIITDRGIRLGTSEITRRGMKEKEMIRIGSLIEEVFKKRRSKAEIKTGVHRLVREFDTIEFAIR